MSGVKVGKKTPLTLTHFGFDTDGSVLAEAQLPSNLVDDWKPDEANASKPFPSYASLLPRRGASQGESHYSWTVGFAARHAKAREEMQPLLDEAAAIKAEVVDLKEQLKRLKKEKADKEELNAVDGQIREKEKTAKDLEAKVGERTPRQFIGGIEQQGRIVSEALARRASLMVVA
jgi:type I restriction enzyme M protein